MRRFISGLALTLCCLPMPACAAAAPEASQRSEGETRVQDQSAPGKPVSGLPYSEGRVFHSLDEYLAFLRKAGEYDTPWYRKVGPDRYELAGRRFPGSAPTYVTREELMRKFGFDR